MASHIAQVFVVILAIVLINSCYAQLTFTPNWGKRSTGPLDTAGAATLNLNSNGNNIGDSAFRFGTVRNPPNFNGNNCKPSVDSVMLIYRMIQAEADKLDECIQK